MTTALSSSLLGVALVAGLALGVRLTVTPLVRVALPEGQQRREAVAVPAPPVAGDSVRQVLVARDPFRLTRRPSPLAYDRLRAGQPPPPPVLKPVLVLDGIVWDGGRSPTALVEGMPGVDGPRVVRAGDVVGGLHVTAIRPDQVVIVGSDTLWTLTVKEPWK